MNRFLQSNRQKRTVLVVDDELVNRELLEAVLSLNYEVTTVSSGVEAMEKLRAADQPFSLILLDLLMPKMSGFEVIEACKSDEKLKGIPIIVMTSEKSAEVRSIRMGADDFIAKPYRMPEVILARCERIIELSEEKSLIRSLEKDTVTGLYVKLFFDAYVRRLVNSVRGKMDAVVLRIDGLRDLKDSERKEVLRKTAQLTQETLLCSKGIACRRDDDMICAYCGHKDDYEGLLGSMQRSLEEEYGQDIRLRAGICENVGRSVDDRFERAQRACDSLTAESDRHTAVYAD